MNPNKRVTNNLIALGSAAVIAVYSAGYVRTESAAQRFADEDAERRPARLSGGVETLHAATPDPVAAAPPPAAAATPVAAPAPAPHALPAKPKPRATPAPTMAPAVDSVHAPAAPVPLPARDSAAATVAAAATGATQTTDSTAQPADKEKARFREGTYTGWGTSRHGDVQATVEIKAGRIVNAYVSICLTQYSCSLISALGPQVVVRQSPEVDFVSGATQSTNAFYYAVVEALAKAK